MTQECSSRRSVLFLAIAIFAISLVPKAAFAGDDRSSSRLGSGATCHTTVRKPQSAFPT